MATHSLMRSQRQVHPASISCYISLLCQERPPPSRDQPVASSPKIILQDKNGKGEGGSSNPITNRSAEKSEKVELDGSLLNLQKVRLTPRIVL
jgi:hypothetical protein